MARWVPSSGIVKKRRRLVRPIKTPTMTFQGFTEALSRRRDISWKIEDGFLRGYDEAGRCFCPTTAVYHAQTGVFMDQKAAYTARRRLGLSEMSARVILDLSDNDTSRPLFPKMWKKMQAACRLNDPL